MTTKQKQEEKIEAIETLRRVYKLRPGSRIYTKVGRVSSSGMSRTMSLYVVDSDKRISNITRLVAKATGYTIANNDELRIRGCGMDMCFAVVYSLGRAMYPKGFKLAKGQYGRNGDKSGFDNDGGYAFRKEQL